MAKSKTAKNGHERITTDRDRIRHLEYFMNGQWRHSNKCKEFTNKECMVRISVSSWSWAFKESPLLRWLGSVFSRT